MEFVDKLSQVLQDSFGSDPGYKLELDPSPSDRITGVLTSAHFEGKREFERQNMIWDVLDDNLTDDERFKITLFIANTPEETAALEAEQRQNSSGGRPGMS